MAIRFLFRKRILALFEFEEFCGSWKPFVRQAIIQMIFDIVMELLNLYFVIHESTVNDHNHGYGWLTAETTDQVGLWILAFYDGILSTNLYFIGYLFFNTITMFNTTLITF